MASTVGSRYLSGKVAATNAAIEVKTLGFKPAKVKVTNLTNQVSVEAIEALGAGVNLKRVALGDLSIVASGGVEFLTGVNPGFTIPVLADINDAAGEDLLWEAIEDVATEI